MMKFKVFILHYYIFDVLMSIMEAKNVKRVIIDLDVGTDDYLALLILLHAEKIGDVKIEAIISTMGNSSLHYVTQNVVRLLEIAGRTDIPVYKGAEEQFIRPKQPIDRFHGEDGFGDLHHDKQPNLSIVRDTPAAIAIHDIITKNPKEISIMCVGPLTNLALAIKLYSDLADNIKDVWIMGGNNTAVGNITSAAEYNFYVDPEAAYIVLDCVTCPMYILPWEPCQSKEITFKWRYDVLGNKTPILHLLTLAEKKVYDDSYEFWTPCDAFLSFCFLNPEKYITKQSAHHATVELYSCFTRGQMVLDHLKNKTPNVTVIEKFDTELFKEVILNTQTL